MAGMKQKARVTVTVSGSGATIQAALDSLLVKMKRLQGIEEAKKRPAVFGPMPNTVPTPRPAAPVRIGGWFENDKRNSMIKVEVEKC